MSCLVWLPRGPSLTYEYFILVHLHTNCGVCCTFNSIYSHGSKHKHLKTNAVCFWLRAKSRLVFCHLRTLPTDAIEFMRDNTSEPLPDARDVKLTGLLWMSPSVYQPTAADWIFNENMWCVNVLLLPNDGDWPRAALFLFFGLCLLEIWGLLEAN